MARAGAGVIIDDVFLDGAVSQQRTSENLEGLEVLWVGVHCAPDVAAARERARGDRPAGMAVGQARAVHRGVVYDLVVDTSTASPMECASLIAARVTWTASRPEAQGAGSWVAGSNDYGFESWRSSKRPASVPLKRSCWSASSVRQ